MSTTTPNRDNGWLPGETAGLAPVPRLAMRPPDAAASLGISERTLWERTKAGSIPCVKLGRLTLYPTEQLRQWLAEQVQCGGQSGEDGAEQSATGRGDQTDDGRSRNGS